MAILHPVMRSGALRLAALRPSALRPVALRLAALRPSALRPVALRFAALRPSALRLGALLHGASRLWTPQVNAALRLLAVTPLLGATGSSGSGIDFQPSTSALPGGDTLRQLTDGIGGWALVAALVGLVLGAATWALGAHSNNYQHTVTGRRAVLVSAIAALLIGAAPTLINFMFTTGQGAK